MSIMRNSNCDQNLKEGDLVWCKNTSPTHDQINMMYNLCRVIDIKSDNQVLLSKYNDYSDYVFLADPKNLSKANYLFSLDQNDMMKLRYINEPSVLYHLKERFKSNKFYTKMGPLLIFINPKINTNINNEEIIEKYKCIDCVEDLSLNEYHVVHNALKNLNELKRNQSIIISGESGSGKSEIAKNIINFIAYQVKGSRRLPTMLPMVDKNEVTEENESEAYESSANNQEENNFNEENTKYQFNMSEMLKHVNVVMEAFGNAITVNNKNSSRFSKFCTIHLENEEIKSFHIKKFLLDKERLINRKANENSFNVFYYMINGSSDKFKKMYFLKNIENYSMLNNEKGFEKFTDYSGKILELLKSLNYIFDDDKEIDFIFSVLSALLLLGNTEIVKAFRKKSLLMGRNACGQSINYETILSELENSEDIGLDENVKNLLLACKLLSFDVETFVKYFTTNYIFNDSILIKVHNETKIQKKLENFIKTCYEELFNWIVYKINDKCTQLQNINENTNYINILDMAYFENSKYNSLEQLLINTTNEEVIKIKNNCLYKKVILSYNEDGIFCEYNMQNIDNEPLCDLLVGSTEECLFSFLENASTKTIFDKSSLHTSIIRKFGRDSKYIKKDDVAGNKKTFVITHSCGDITYNVENFVEKNIDILTNRFIDMVKQSENEYMRQFCMFYNYDNSGNIVEEKRRYSIQSALKLFKRRYDTKNQMAVSLLRNNLTELEKLQHATFCHFILCMKPNESKRELYSFDANIVLRQARNFSIVEASQLKIGYYPHKFTLNEFLSIFDKKTKNVDEESAEDQCEVVDVKNENEEENVEQDEDIKEKIEQNESAEEKAEQNESVEEKAEQDENVEEKVEQNADAKEQSNECLKEKVGSLIKSYQINNHEWIMGNNMVFISNHCLRLLIINVFPKYEHFNISYEQHIEHMRKSALNNLNDVSNLECVKFDETYNEQEINIENNDKPCSEEILKDNTPSNKEDTPKKGSKNRLSQLYQFFGFKRSSKSDDKKNSIKIMTEEQLVLKEDENSIIPIDDKCDENKDKSSSKNKFEILSIVNKNRIKINESIKQFFTLYNCYKPYSIYTKGCGNLCYASFVKKLTMGSEIFQDLEIEKYQAIQDLFGEKTNEQEDAASEAAEGVKELEAVKEVEVVEEIEAVNAVKELEAVEVAEEVEAFKELEVTEEASDGPVEGNEIENAETIGEDIAENIEPMNEEPNENKNNNGKNKKKKRRRRRKRKSTSTVKSESIGQKEELSVWNISNETEDKEVSVENAVKETEETDEKDEVSVKEAEPIVEEENTVEEIQPLAEVESVVKEENIMEVEFVEEENPVEVESIVEEITPLIEVKSAEETEPAVEIESIEEIKPIIEVGSVIEEENAAEAESANKVENVVEVESVEEIRSLVEVESILEEIRPVIEVESVVKEENVMEVEFVEEEENVVEVESVVEEGNTVEEIRPLVEVESVVEEGNTVEEIRPLVEVESILEEIRPVVEAESVVKEGNVMEVEFVEEEEDKNEVEFVEEEEDKNEVDVESVVEEENVVEVEFIEEDKNEVDVESVEEIKPVIEVESAEEIENLVEVESVVDEEKQNVAVEDVTDEIKEDDGEVSMEEDVMMDVEEVGTKENINEIEVNENEEILFDENLYAINCEINEIDETEESIEKENINENNCDDDDENKLFENNKETQQDINNILNDETKASSDEESRRNSAANYLKMILSIEKEDFNNIINFNNYEKGQFKQFISCYTNLDNISLEECFKNVDISNYKDQLGELNSYGPEIVDSTNKNMLLNNLNDLFVYKSKEKENFMTILKNMTTVMENVHGKKWNILMTASDYHFKSYLYNEDKIIYINNNNDFNEKIIYNYEEDEHVNKVKNNGTNGKEEKKRHSLSYAPIVEYLSLSGANKNVHEICISNNADKKYFDEKYEILCFRSKTVSKLEYMNAKSFYTSINYKKVKTRCLTHAHIDFTYMDDQMKNNFKQHVINEFINNPNIRMDDLSDSLLKLATYFYPSNKGTWCVFISKRRSFTGSIHIVKNRYLRMTVKNKNRKYNIVIFETPV
ncbi:myosin-like protein, putative [Plasmodium vinckei lentum]|uniref:Myosin-like protein, putative n=1 Tax=Plasmodium vinckei lentum TaxID=138297 RepID=A0A6V7RT37_PLAVN|nr:myosin-like protein, putative [Plasmodium vinckei lentum]